MYFNKIKIISWVFMLLSLFSATTIQSQTYKFKNFGVKEGLSQSFVYCINQDSKGYLWVGTGEGLCKFDGINFKTFLTNDSLAENFITSSFRDKSGNLWFGHSHGGITFYDGNQFKIINTKDKINSAINNIIEDDNGNIWLVAQNEGLLRINKNLEMESLPKGLNDVIFYSICFINNSELFIGTSNGLFLNTLTGNNHKLLRSFQINAIPSTKIQCIYKQKNDNSYLIGTEDEGLFQLFPDKNKENQFSAIKVGSEYHLENENIQDVFQDNEGNLWLATFGNGVYKLFVSKINGKYEEMVNYSENNGLGNKFVKDVFQDNQGNIWAGTYGNGIVLFTNDYFNFYEPKNAKYSSNIFSVFFDEQNEWYGVENGLLRMESGKVRKITFYTALNGLPKDKIIALFKDINGLLWIGTGKSGIYQMNIKDEKFAKFHLSDNILENSINAITGDINKIWIATISGVFSIDLKTSSKQHYTIRDGLPNNNIKHIYKDSKGRIWIASYGKYICAVTKKGILKYALSTGSEILDVISITEDKDKNIWFATYGNGIYKYDTSLSKNISITQGLFSDYCYSIISDDSGYVWVAHQLGLSRINTNDFSVKTFTKKDGIVHNCNFNAVFKDKKGNICFGTSLGTIKYEPAKNKKNFVPPWLNITSVKFSDKNVDFSKNLVCPYNIYKLRIEFMGIDFREPDKVTYQYKLDGYDLYWSEFTNINYAQYNRIEDGNYTFIIKAYNNDGVCTEKLLKIKINPPFWKTWWFIISVIIIIIASVYLFYKSRINRFKKRQIILESLVDERTKEVMNQKEEIELKNVELEKLSIVASETANAITIYDRDGTIEYRNNAFWKLYGDKLQEAVFNIGDNIKALGKHHIVQEHFSKCVNDKKSVVYSTSNMPKSGDVVWVQTTLTPILSKEKQVTKVVSIDTDITDIKFSEEKIRLQSVKLEEYNKELEKLSIVARETDNAIVIAAPTGEIEWINEGFTRLFGYTLDDLKQLFGTNLIKTSSNPEIKNVIKKCLEEKKSIVYSVLNTKKSGEQIWVQTTLTPILDDSNIIKKLVAIDSDITAIEQEKQKVEIERQKVKERNTKLWETYSLLNKEKEKVEEVKKIIEEKNKNITDSINYALKIQEALIPKVKTVKQYFNESFILFKPRDIVSGDFYWIAEVENQIIITVADCTGHGVPGALMSMLGMSILKEIVVKEYITQPALILKRLRKEIINVLHQTGTEGEQIDGMDMALCAIELTPLSTSLKTGFPSPNGEGNCYKMQFAGANNPLYIVRGGQNPQGLTKPELLQNPQGLTKPELLQNLEGLEEIKGNKMPIAIYQIMENFTNNEIQINKGDTIYLFSDGYADQFGGDNNKKITSKRFKMLLAEIQQLSMEKQKVALEKFLFSWKEDNEQTDDITVLGIKL